MSYVLRGAPAGPSAQVAQDLWGCKGELDAIPGSVAAASPALPPSSPPQGFLFFPPQEVSRDFIPKGGFCSPERISGLLQRQAVRDGDRGAAAAPGARLVGPWALFPPSFLIFSLFFRF